MAMDMSQEQLMEIISQLDSALSDLSSSTIPPPPPPPLLPSDPWCTVTPSAPVRLPLPPLAAAAPEQVTTAEMVYLAAAMRPVVCVDAEAAAAAAPRPRRRNVRISSQPQSVAARLRRERVSQRMRVLQRLVPGGTRMDTASMLDEAIRYVKFLKGHVHSLEKAASAAALHGRSGGGGGGGDGDGGGGHVAAGRQYHSSPYFV